ncbi:mucin-2-like isoform X3 [Anopheles stephensi]|uniref:mucin-2-like isoform X3 n=1 Tax=Anopheles stephensi TaxID=30069 RepID=UPI0016589E21|nr:mucin-2-like isoform X3 [Anopheles stephensi]XP_035915883.1 mucin-2-like isoform X3 [Anopheles stephensi]
MRKVWLLASAVLAFLNFVKSQEVARTLYSTRYDNLDIDTILGSNRLVSNYVDCLLSRKPCPPEGKDLKRILPEALRTKCARCSPIQKENALKIITRLYYDYPDQYRALRERWDPSGEYHRRFEEYLRGLQFNQIGGGGSGSSNGGTGVGNTIESGGNDRPAPPPVVVNRFGDDGGNSRPSIAPVPAVPVPVPQTTTTQRPTTTTVRQTRPATRQTTTRNTQRTTTRFITRVPPTPPPPTTTTTTPRTITTTRTSTILQQRPPPPPQPSPAQQQPILPPQAPPPPPQPYPTIIYERPQAPPRASPPPPPPPARPFYIPPEPPRTPPTTQSGQTTPDSVIDHFFVPPSQAAQLPPSPIVGLWNQLGTKIADTADAIAGMLQKTVDVLVTSHIQSHQRALRRS